MNKKRKIFFVMAGGGHETDRHYYETINKKRSADEFGKFLKTDEVEKLKNYANGLPYAVWGAVPGVSNVRNWQSMDEGDYVMVYRKGKIILAAEVAMKVQNPDLGRYFWQEDDDGKTWEYIYFMINDVAFNVEMSKLNKYLGYEENYHPQGFMAIQQEKVDKLLSVYGDLISLLQKLDNGQEIEQVEVEIEKKKIIDEVVEEQIERAPTEHTEMQWRLIRLGARVKFDVWVPENDQGRQYEGNNFRDHVIKEFRETIDVPKYVKNIDVVWKLGYSIKSAFEIENSTSIYSGILRLSDLRALTPNSNCPLFIVADKSKRDKVFQQIERPTFTNVYLQLDKIVRYLSYDKVRKLDEDFKGTNAGFDVDWLLEQGELVK